MKINKNTSYVLLHVLNGNTVTAEISPQMPGVDIRSIQRALASLTEFGLVKKSGTNSPSYAINYEALLHSEIADKLLEDENRPLSRFHHEFITWLGGLSEKEVGLLFENHSGTGRFTLTGSPAKMSAKELEYLTVELSWKSSSLEGNTYTLLDTQLLLLEGIKAKNKTDFETQMVINHKNAVTFIVENPELFKDAIAFRTVEELHRIIGYNLGIDAGIRKKLVKISASNYEPLPNPHQLKENLLTILGVISRPRSAFIRALLALALVPYLQAFEDGNKRTGRMLANAILISSVNKGFSLRKTDARKLALTYLSFYEFNSIKGLSKILKTELTS